MCRARGKNPSLREGQQNLIAHFATGAATDPRLGERASPFPANLNWIGVCVRTAEIPRLQQQVATTAGFTDDGFALSKGPRLRLPAFLGLGAQKAGTTTLHRLLVGHPGVFLPPVKEVHYFTLHYQLGPGWYSRHYDTARDEQCCGDITPYYLFHPAVPQRLQQLLPAARLVVLLRDPVERALSGVFHSIRLGFEPLSPAAALAAEAGRLAGSEEQLLAGLERHPSHQEHSYLSRSRYELQLARYEALFPPDQLLILRSEDLFSDPEPLWRRLLAFLGLQDVPLPERLPVENAGKGEADGVDSQLRGWLRQQLEPTYALMEQRYGLRWPAS